MVSSLDNKLGARCPECQNRPRHYWTASCPRGCGHLVMACGYCGTQADVERQLETHVATCNYSLATLAGPDLSPKVDHVSTRFLMKHAARHGAVLGKNRGPTGAALGGVLGAVLGGLAGHVLNHPDVRPIVDAARGLVGPLQEVSSVVRGIRNDSK